MTRVVSLCFTFVIHDRRYTISVIYPTSHKCHTITKIGNYTFAKKPEHRDQRPTVIYRRGTVIQIFYIKQNW